MAPTPQNAPQWQERLKEELTRNMKQTCILGVLLVVGLFVGIKALAKKPASANAAVPSVAEAGIMGTPGTGAVPAFRARSDAASQERDEYIGQISHDISRDLFSIQPDLYELVRAPVPVNQPELADPEQAEPEDVQAIVEARATGLHLQSVIDSDTPIAVINGRVLAVGDTIDGFCVQRVATGVCVVTQAGVEVSLEIDAD